MQPPSPTKKSKKKGRKTTGFSKGGKQTMVSKDVWHLAKPIGRKPLHPSDRVLCIIPAVVGESVPGASGNGGKTEFEDEECFAGSVVELHNGHVRVRLDGLGKKEDVWMTVDSPKLFLDGGRWEDNEESFKMPEKHYWKEEDSKEACA
jgi:hypothetical protein